MKCFERGQLLIITGLSLVVFLLLLGGGIELCRILVFRSELNRAADAAGKAGLILVGDQILTQQAESRSDMNDLLSTPELDGQSGGHFSTLTAPPMQTQVADEVRVSLAANGFIESDPMIKKIEVAYPLYSRVGEVAIEVRLVYIVKGVARYLIKEGGVIYGHSIQSIPQR